MNLNRVQLIGRLTKDPELRSTQGGTSVLQISFATSRQYLQNGKKVEQSEFHNLVAWGKLADTLSKYCQKGQEMFFEGRLQTRKWQDKQQNTRYSTEVVVETFSFGSRPKNAPARSEQRDTAPSSREDEPTDEQLNAPSNEQPIDVEDIPF